MKMPVEYDKKYQGFKVQHKRAKSINFPNRPPTYGQKRDMSIPRGVNQVNIRKVGLRNQENYYSKYKDLKDYFDR